MPNRTLVLILLVLLTQANTVSAEEDRLVRDSIWVWGNPEMATPGSHTMATFAQASPAERAEMLGVSNIILAGNGLPADDQAARDFTHDTSHAERLVWEIASDSEESATSFVYDKTIERLSKITKEHTQVEGVLLDDMSSIAIEKGFKPRHIRNIRHLISKHTPETDIWGVVYTMNLGIRGIDKYIQELDILNLWTWHAKDLKHLEENVVSCRESFPHKPIVLGLYLYDYEEGRSMPADLMEHQCKVALKLLQKGEIQGIVFLTINNEPETIKRAAEWIQQVGDQKIDATQTESQKVRLNGGEGWDYKGGQWTENEEGIIRPEDVRNLHSRAFDTSNEFSDLTVEFEFNGDYRETGTGSAGLVLRASDPNHFYFVYFPWGGQQLRAKHFWANVAKVEGDGYFRNIAAEWVPGLPSETDRWYRVRVVAKGPQIDVWVDDIHSLSVTDSTFKMGCIGLAGYGWYAFRNVRVDGIPQPLEEWDRSIQIPAHSFELKLPGDKMPSGTIAPNGDILLAGGNQLIRSKDKGRTWEEPETLAEKLGEITDYGSSITCTSDGQLLAMLYEDGRGEEGGELRISLSESKDNGRTWSDPIDSEVASGWPEQPKTLVPYGSLVETGDGSLVRFLLGGVKEENTTFTDVRTWGATHAKAFAIRSEDGGSSWSSPIELDRPSWVDSPRGSFPGSLDFTEPTGVVIGDRLTVLIRPVYSPYMWQCWSYDQGRSWDAAVRATFPGYAQSMVRTESGDILCAHRYPHYSVNISRDNGLHWDAGTVIDYPVWAMGHMIEVDKDIVLATYMNADRSMPLLSQLIRITETDIVPVPQD